MQMARGMKMWCRGLRMLPWLLLAWLASCGGGTTQIEPFAAQRVIYIGDETVGLLPDGTRYGINVLNASGVFDCAQFAIWTQQIAVAFGFTTDFCGGGAFGVTRATPNAKAADIEGQISAQIAASGVGPKDLFIVMVGMNDIIELYEQFAGPKDLHQQQQHRYAPGERAGAARQPGGRASQPHHQCQRALDRVDGARPRLHAVCACQK